MLPAEREQFPSQVVFAWLENNGSKEMAIDGSAGARYFNYTFPRNGRHFRILNVQINISGGKVDDPEFFGGLPNALANGLEMGFYVKDGDDYTPTPLANYKTNYDLVSQSSSSKPWGFTKDARDVMIIKLFEDYTIMVDPHKYDAIYAKVQDDLSALHSMSMCIRGYFT